MPKKTSDYKEAILYRQDLVTLFDVRKVKDKQVFSAVCPPPDGRDGAKGTWTLKALSAWCHGLLFGEPGEDESRLKTEKMRREVDIAGLKRESLRLDVARKKDLTIPASEVVDYGCRLCSEVKAQLQSVGASIAVRCSQASSPAEIQGIIDERIASALESLSSWRWDVDGFRDRRAETPEDADGASNDEEDDNGED